MSLIGKATKALPFAAAAFPGADLVIRAIPVPTDFAVMIKIPTALLCLAIAAFAKTPKSKQSALRWAFGGIGCVALYAMLATVLLHADPLRYAAGDYSVVGLWPTPAAVAERDRRHVDMTILRNETGPVEWGALYSAESQLAAAAILGVAYGAAFTLLTLAFKKLPNASTNKAPRAPALEDA